MSLTKPKEYKGKVSIAQDKLTSAALQTYLDDSEPEYLTDLLGCELYDLFVADLDGNNIPQSPRFTAIYDAFCFDIDTVCIMEPWYIDYFPMYAINNQNKSRGMLAMLRGFMFFEYTRDQPQVNSSIGTSTSKGVASDLIAPTHTVLVREYNKSLVDYWNIQYFIRQDTDTYPEYNGLIKRSISII